jgi:hypothetical protein
MHGWVPRRVPDFGDPALVTRRSFE